MQRYINRYIQSWIFHFSQIVWHARWNFHDNCDQKTKRNLICIKIKSRVCVYHPMVKESIFLKPRLTRASSFPKRTNWEARENRVSNRFLLSLHHASVILLPNSALAYSSTRRRGVEKKGNERRVYEKRRPVIEVFSLESSTYARYSTRTSRCVASSHEARRKRPTLFPLFLFAGTYTLLSRKVFSLALVSYLRRRSSRGWRGSNFFFPTTLLYRHPFGFRSVSSTVEVGVLLHLFNPEKENIESIFFKQGIKHERERE